MDDIYKLKDEEIWVHYMLALANNPKLASNLVEEDAFNADAFLYEFRIRFRE